MDLQAEAAKIRKVLEEVEVLISTATGEHADELVRLHSFFVLALSQIPTSPTAPSGVGQE